MFKVKDFMTKDVICTEKDTTISEIIDLMNQNKIHRVPVTENGKLVGLITEGMISNSGTSQATSLSIYELNYLLSKTTVETVMIKNVVSVDQDELMEYATSKMLKSDIGCLPVVDQTGDVVGILTQNDVFSCFLNVLGWDEVGARITVSVKDEVGAIGKLSAIFVEKGINISHIGVYSFENGVLTINADAFTAFQTGNKKFGVTAKNEQGLTVVFEITTTVELVADPVTLEGVREIVLSSGTTFDIDLGEYTSATALSATLGGENATYSNGKLTIAEELRANTQKHGMQTLKVTVEKEGKYYAVTVNVLVVTQDITTFEELQSALAFNENNVKFGYYRLKNSLSTNEQYQSGNNVGGGIWKNPTGELGFRGTLDGNNFSIQETFWNTGLFGYVGKGAVIKNITFNMNEYNLGKMLFGYSMIGATVDNVKVNVTKSDGITAIPTGDNVSGLLTAIFSYGNTFNNLVVDAQNTDVDTLFGSCAYYSYPAEYEANKFTACTVKAKSLIGIACTDNTNKTVIEPTEIDGLTVTLS